MAATNISNIDGADAVTNIGAGGETTLKAACQAISADDKRFATLYVGQMSAEGFASVSHGLLYYVQSPTAKVEVHAEDAGGRLVAKGYLLINAVMTLAAVRYL